MLALCSAFLFLLAPLPQSEELIERTYDVRALDAFAEVDALVPDPRLPLAAAYLDALAPDPEALMWPDGGVLPYGHWDRVILNLLLQEESEEVGTLDSIDGGLVASATEQGHARIESLLADIETVALRDCSIEVHLLDPAMIPDRTPNVLSMKQTRELLSATPSSGTQVQRGRLARPTSIEMISRQAVLFDYDVEVAQYSSAQDPQVTVLKEGLLGGVLVDERGDGMLGIRFWARWGEAHRPIASVVSGPDDEQLQLPAADGMVIVASADVEPGGAVLVTGAELPHAVLIRPRVEPRLAKATDQLAIIDAADALDRPHVVLPSVIAGPSPSGGWSWDELISWEEDWGVDHSPMDADDLDVLLADALPHPSTLVGKHVLVRVAESDRAEVAKAVAKLIPPRVSTYTLELRGGVVPFADLGAFEGSGADAAIRSLPLLVSGAARDGDTLALKAGTEHFYIKDYDIEVAQGAFAADPIIGEVFAGSTLWARITAAPNGQVDFQYAMTRAELLEIGSPLVTREPESEFPGIQLPRMRVSDLSGDQPTPLDEWVHLETRSLDGESARVTFIRLREVQR